MTSNHPVKLHVRDKSLNLLRTICSLCEESSPDLGARIIREGMRVVKARIDEKKKGGVEKDGKRDPIYSLESALKLVLQPSLNFVDSPAIYRTFVKPVRKEITEGYPGVEEIIKTYEERVRREEDGGGWDGRGGGRFYLKGEGRLQARFKRIYRGLFYNGGEEV